ncbi:MAG: histidine--tRNA ligase [Patescibacteria group bacterium]|jgi:histidyl-tRNA synthetase
MPRIKLKKDNKAGAGERDKDPKERRERTYSRLRGMRDVLFDEYRYYDLVEGKVRDLAEVYGFRRVMTPVLEKAELYERATGKTTDIVTKEMYVFADKNGDRVALRPELTPSMVRAYIEHGMLNLPQPVKMYMLGSCFRHEKPQAGRLRQHHQFGLEMFGEEKPSADAQIILIAYNFFKELQLNVQIQINSIGCKECRSEYEKKLIEFYNERGKRSKLCPDCKKRLKKNPLRLLDCKELSCVAAREDAPQIVDFLCEPCKNHFIKVLEYLDELNVPYNLNPYLVRGLDYYNRTVFEVWPHNAEASAGQAEALPGDSAPADNEGEEAKVADNLPRQASLGGGGRYDGLVEYMGGRPTPGLGFGLGIERTIAKIKEKSIPLKKNGAPVVFVAQLGDASKRKAMALFEDLRRAGFAVRQAFTKDSLKVQLEEANRLESKFSLILGQKEVMDGTILVRDMESGIQEVIDFNKIKSDLEKRIAEKK